MRSAGVAVLKSNLSELLTAVKAGEEVCVTERGRAIARIVPVSAGGEDGMAFAELERAGSVKRPVRPLDETFWDLTRGQDAGGAVRAALAADREESR